MFDTMFEMLAGLTFILMAPPLEKPELCQRCCSARQPHNLTRDESGLWVCTKRGECRERATARQMALSQQ